MDRVYTWPMAEPQAGSSLSDRDRLSFYSRATAIYEGRFYSAFPTNPAFQFMRGTHANLAARAVNATKSAIWAGEPKALHEVPEVQAFGTEFLSDPRVSAAISQNVTDTVLYGDGVLKVSIKNGKIKVNAVNPGCYFPKLDISDPEEPLWHDIVYISHVDDTGTWYRRERYEFKEETGTYWLTVSLFSGKDGSDSPVKSEDLRIAVCPIIHTHGNRLSGQFYGKARLMDCEQMVAEYAATIFKLSVITDMVSTRAMLAAPEAGFSENGELQWDSATPLMVRDDEAKDFDINKYGWVATPGAQMVGPSLDFLAKLEADIYSAFGLTRTFFGDTGDMRDVGAPGIERVNMVTAMTVQDFQAMYSIALSDLCNVAMAFSRVWLKADIAEGYQTLKFSWPSFAPESESEKLDSAIKKMELGIPKVQIIEELGYRNAPELLDMANGEQAGLFGLTRATELGNDPVTPDALFEG